MPKKSNKPKVSSGASKYAGVRRNVNGDKWIALPRQNGKTVHCGTFDTEEEAARARDKVIYASLGDYHLLNFPYDYISMPDSVDGVAITRTCCVCDEVYPVAKFRVEVAGRYPATKYSCEECREKGRLRKKDWDVSHEKRRNLESKEKYGVGKSTVRIRSNPDSYFKFVLSRTKARAKKENMDFNLDYEYLKNLYKFQNGRCALTNRPMKLGSTRDEYRMVAMSIDRIDSYRGYTTDNIQLVVTCVNLAKQMFSSLEFLDICKDVTKLNNDLSNGDHYII